MSPEQLIPLIAVLIALPLILLRNRRPRILRPQWLWVMPLIVVGLIGFGMWGMSYSDPEHSALDATSWTILAAGGLLGAAFGWWRGKMVTIEKHADGTLKAQASPLGVVIIIAVLVLRQALKPWLEANAEAWHVNPLAILEAFMVFAAAMIVVQRIEMFIRARRIQSGGTDAHVEAASQP
jgi:membrane protein CcdC involved in cytochrome C biogenesis